ncbi:thiol-disulfide oxidoreductase DCC family protein [Halopiger goleimassiliensis]|uniref:thiol-disulfide oxidoreductase DCC family protein n=1 Tax=Halopiger goleimassiliensis TaxID=1293048 RepID=UPI00067820DF|nr:thiol-disulfide oxidoreductase DCC family protein [Halopiger goleimassiliensis]
MADEQSPTDAADDPLEIDDPIVLFDGVCNLCTGFVQFLVPRDPEGRFHFASLQSDVGERLLTTHGLAGDELDSIVLIEGEDVYVKSAAVIRIASILGGIYALARPLRYLPRRLRDWGYDLVAANRYRLFGKKEQCMMPSEDVQSRFLD